MSASNPLALEDVMIPVHNSAIRAHRVLGDPARMKKPSAHKSSFPRECDVCQKPLSKYNKGPNCYAHSETKYPRVRGHVN